MPTGGADGRADGGANGRAYAVRRRRGAYAGPTGEATAEPTPYAAAARTERHERTAEARDGRP